MMHETDSPPMDFSAVPLKLRCVCIAALSLNAANVPAETHGVKFSGSASLRSFSGQALSVRGGRMLTAGPVIVFHMKCVIILARFRGIGKGKTRNFAGNQRQTKLHERVTKGESHKTPSHC